MWVLMLALVVGSVALVALLAVLLMQLGVTREVVVLQEKVAVFSQLLLRPPVPSFLRGSLPRKAIAAVQAVGHKETGPFIIVFMRHACGGCRSLAEGLQQATATGLLARDDVICFLEQDSAGSNIESLMRNIAKSVNYESSEVVFRACEVSATPTMLAVNPKTWEVFGHSVGGDAAWAVSRLEMARRNQLRLSTAENHPTTSDSPASN
jgi:hypothetical protein